MKAEMIRLSSLDVSSEELSSLDVLSEELSSLDVSSEELSSLDVLSEELWLWLHLPLVPETILRPMKAEMIRRTALRVP